MDKDYKSLLVEGILVLLVAVTIILAFPRKPTHRFSTVQFVPSAIVLGKNNQGVETLWLDRDGGMRYFFDREEAKSVRGLYEVIPRDVMLEIGYTEAPAGFRIVEIHAGGRSKRAFLTLEEYFFDEKWQRAAVWAVGLPVVYAFRMALLWRKKRWVTD